MLKALILAGGLGTRLKKIVDNVPKPMADINGNPFLRYLLDYLINEGVSKIFISTGYKSQIITNYFGKIYRGVEIEYSIETSQLGTGGAISFFEKKHLNNESILILNGDSFFPINLRNFILESEIKKTNFSIALFKSSDFQRYSQVNINDEHEIINFGSKLKHKKSFFVNGGIYYVNLSELKHYLNLEPPFSLENDLIPYILNKKFKMHGFYFKSPFLDIGIPEDYLRSSSWFIKHLH